MDLFQKFIDEVLIHYKEREFPLEALKYLENIIHRNVMDDKLVFTGQYQLTKPIVELLGKFSSIVKKFESPEHTDAVFCFSFGYRLKNDIPGVENRLSGKNNKALACIVKKIKNTYPQIPVYAQFEVADALQNNRVDYKTPVEDIGTGKVIKHFIKHMNDKKFNFKRVTVIAHKHHIHRCILLLERNGIEGFAPLSIKLYDEYDEQEKQLRVKSPEEFIISDFVSMCAIL